MVRPEPTTINGVNVLPGVYVNDLYVANGTITNLKVANGAIDTAKIANLAVDTAKIADGTITNAKIANLAVDTAKIANLAVGTLQIAGNAVTIPLAAELASQLQFDNFTGFSQSGTVLNMPSFVSNGAPVLLSGLIMGGRLGSAQPPAECKFSIHGFSGTTPTILINDASEYFRMPVSFYIANPQVGIISLSLYVNIVGPVGATLLYIFATDNLNSKQTFLSLVQYKR